MQRVLVFLFLTLTFVLSGCEQLALEASRRFTVELDPASLTVSRGSEGSTKVTIKPITGFDLGSESAEVTLIKPPTGVTAGALTIPAGISSRELTIQVAANAETVVDKEITIQVDKGGRGAEATLKLTIQ
jgi:hypothetical protein